jgi:predicted aminopeptidase
MNDPLTPSHVKDRLALVPDLKRFVEKTLGVRPTGNYSTYVNLKRPYVVWVVLASESFALKAKTWSFPIAGTVPYLGFFSESAAKKYGDELRAQGLDVVVRGAAAYSTLGWLRDPLLSSMLGDGPDDLVNLLFHETTHSYLYVPGDSTFNESAASFIGEYGEREFIEDFYQGEERARRLKNWADQRRRRYERAQDAKRFAGQLRDLYAASKDDSFDDRLAKKRAAFEAFWAADASRRHLENNAALMHYLTYEDNQAVFDEIYQRCGRSVRRAFEYLLAFAGEYESLKEKSPAKDGSSARAQDLLVLWGDGRPAHQSCAPSGSTSMLNDQPKLD